MTPDRSANRRRYLALWFPWLPSDRLRRGAIAGDASPEIGPNPAPVVLVANEVGLGIVPENALARAFRDEAGRLNQRAAAAAGRVVFVAAGIPLVMKEAPR